jgi:UDP-glucuronate decarboxylase
MLDYHGFEVIRHDVTFPLYLEADQMYNLTWPALPPRSTTSTTRCKTTKTSVHGAINMLGLAKRLRAKIYAFAKLSVKIFHRR